MKLLRTIVAIMLLVCFAWGCAHAAAQVAAEDAAVRFQDVDPDTAVGRAVEDMVRRGVIEGVSEDRFDPDGPISAADYVTMIAKLRGLSPAASSSDVPGAGYMQAALDAHWYDWDQIPPDNPSRYEEPLDRELAANIVVTAFFGSVTYDWSVHDRITDFDDVSGRYYIGVLGGLTLGIFDQPPGTPFYPLRSLSRGDACLWVSNALSKEGPQASPSASASASAGPSVTAATQSPAQQPIEPAGGGVSRNGWLQVRGTQLCNQYGEPIVLHGMSSMGIQWYPQYTDLQCIRNTVSRGANIFRIAMYTEEGGYLSDKPKYKALVEEIVQNAIDADVYVIIDWHILSDGNPMTHIDEAEVFFRGMSEKYADVPNVIYEICNEPNGNITWAADVKPYAERICSIIREHSARGIILIGSPMWDQDVDVAAADPVDGSNLMYTLHFYAGTHHQELRDKATRALELGAPIFVSEWGTSDASGTGGVYIESSDQWMQYMSARGISWCNWSLCDKNETSAALVPGAPSDTTWSENDLSESGRYVFAHFTDGQTAQPSSTVTTAPSQSPAVIKPVTVREAAQQFGSESGCSVIVRQGESVLSEDDAVSTGCTIELVNDSSGDVVRSAVIVVHGDVLGTGTVNLSDLVRMAQAMTESRPLDGPYALAADLDGQKGLSITDLVIEAKLLLDGGTLQCSFASR